MLIIVQGRRVVLYVLWVCLERLQFGAAPLLRITRQCRSVGVIFFGATLLLSITRQCRSAAVCCWPMLPCRLLLTNAALLLFITFRGRPAAVYYLSGLPCCRALLIGAAVLLFIICFGAPR